MYHFADVGKMVRNVKTTFGTGYFCAFYSFRKSSPLHIFKNFLQFSCIPKFLSVFIDVLDTVKCVFTVLF